MQFNFQDPSIKVVLSFFSNDLEESSKSRLSNEYLHDDQIRVFIREMMALAFIPEWEVSIAFQLLCTYTPEDLNVGEFIDYMDRTWINGLFKPELWNVFTRMDLAQITI